MFWRQLVLGCAHVCVCVLSCALSPSLSCVSLGFNESGACLLYAIICIMHTVPVLGPQSCSILGQFWAVLGAILGCGFWDSG